jgi:hypothetical protein
VKITVLWAMVPQGLLPTFWRNTVLPSSYLQWKV